MRWLKIADSRYRKALATVIALTCVSLLLRFVIGNVEAQAALPTSSSLVLEFLSGILLSCLVIRWIYRTTWGKVLLIWLLTVLAGAVNVALVFLLIKLFVLE